MRDNVIKTKSSDKTCGELCCGVSPRTSSKVNTQIKATPKKDRILPPSNTNNASIGKP